MYRSVLILLMLMPLWLAILSAASAADEESAGIDQELHPVALFEFHCWDPLRRSGQPERPSTETLWSTANEETRKLFKLELDPAVEVWIKVDWEQHALVILEFEQRIVDAPGKQPMKLLEQRCRIAHSASHPSLGEIIRRAARLPGPPPRPRRNRRTDQAAITANSSLAWKRWCRAGFLARDDSNWALGPGNSGSLKFPTCLSPPGPELFETRQYVLLRVLGRSSQAPLNIVELERTTRVDDLIELGR